MPKKGLPAQCGKKNLSIEITESGLQKEQLQRDLRQVFKKILKRIYMYIVNDFHQEWASSWPILPV